tara:strand:- start:226 stop:504 length:279 start_codon:yes stop_codon:yes gene_type:complete
MNDFGALFWLFVLIMGILNIILFFKIWAMTNDVNSILRTLLKQKVNQEVDIITNNDGITKEEVIPYEKNDGFKIAVFIGIFIFVLIMIVATA